MPLSLVSPAHFVRPPREEGTLRLVALGDTNGLRPGNRNLGERDRGRFAFYGRHLAVADNEADADIRLDNRQAILAAAAQHSFILSSGRRPEGRDDEELRTVERGDARERRIPPVVTNQDA